MSTPTVAQDATYKLRANDRLLGESQQFVSLLHDLDIDADDLLIEALAASGDCFALLANDLDQLMLMLKPESTERFQLERVVEILLYLQDHHKIVRKAG